MGVFERFFGSQGNLGTEEMDEFVDDYQEIVSYMAEEGELNHLGDQRIRDRGFRETKKAWSNLEKQYRQIAAIEEDLHSIRDSVDFEDDQDVHAGALLTGQKAAEKADIKPEETMAEIAELEYENRIRTSGSGKDFVISLYKNLGLVREEYEGKSNSMREHRDNHYELLDRIVEGLKGKEIESDVLEQAQEEIESQLMISNPRDGNYRSATNTGL